MQKLQPLCSKRHAEIGNAGDVATGPVKVCDEAGLHGVAGGAEHDRIVVVALLAASAAGMLKGAAMRVTRRRTRSAANSGRRSTSLCAHRNSMATFWPSTWPLSLSPLRKAPTRFASAS